ncbi:DNA-3-methyladenine glycosylase II [Pseudonocardia sulfidoxydans NBRC 16205]|uniref:DNA-3-methyladenine glycosylase II n=3 Tax=Pseudonocardia sulfidoxydans TaxID=54011 RepID=A0A511DRS4_9PSEU|nr:DNA-3-methyladenine glycosylase II [Pseudonocardia sulfidoxydans NBRC 16205]
MRSDPSVRRRILVPMTTFRITPRGTFSLAEAAMFGVGHRAESTFDGTMRLAFSLDDLSTQVGVALTEADGDIVGEVSGLPPGGDVEAVRAQVARIVSLDHDATGYEGVAAADPVVAPVLAAAPGLRPVLFHSPYEAAAWSVLSLRWGRRQAAAVRERFAREHGRVLDVAGQQVAAFPTPARLLEIESSRGVPEVKMQRLHGVAKAALAGTFDVATLRDADQADADAALQAIPGIGPFSSALIRFRATGAADLAVDRERNLAEIVGERYGLDGPATDDDLVRLAEGWRPFRTWVAVLLRAASGRVTDHSGKAA